MADHVAVDTVLAIRVLPSAVPSLADALAPLDPPTPVGTFPAVTRRDPDPARSAFRAARPAHWVIGIGWLSDEPLHPAE